MTQKLSPSSSQKKDTSDNGIEHGNGKYVHNVEFSQIEYQSDYLDNE